MQYVGNYRISKLVGKLLFILVLYPYIYSYTVKVIHMNTGDMLYASHLKFIEADEVFLTCFTTEINQVATNVKNF